MLLTPHPARMHSKVSLHGRGTTRAGHGVLAMHTSICTAICLRRAVLASGLVAPVPLAQPLRHRPSSVQRALGRAFTRANGVGPLARAEGGHFQRTTKQQTDCLPARGAKTCFP